MIGGHLNIQSKGFRFSVTKIRFPTNLVAHLWSRGPISWGLICDTPLSQCPPTLSQAKAFVADPSAFVPVVTQSEETDAGGKEGGTGEGEKKEEEEEEESDEDMGFGLFD